MAAGKPWRIEQLGGPKKVIELTGYSAPFGRPRQKPVIEEEISSRVQTVRYPGNSGPPTRHIFGTQWSDQIPINGRWKDSVLGPGGANSMVDEMQNFLADEQPVRVSWGDIVSYTGYLQRLRIGRESESEIVWTLIIDIDQRDGFLRQRAPTGSQLQNGTEKLAEFLAKIFSSNIGSIPSTAPDWSPTLFDAIDDAITNVAAQASALANLANQIDSIEKATITELQRLRLGVESARTALLTFRDTYRSFDMDLALFTRQSESDIQWTAFTSQNEVDTAEILAVLADIEREFLITQRGKTVSNVVAGTADTWENMSIRVYGSADGANRLRDANGVRYGELPAAGRTYQVPTLV